jgi:hypothetical protein
MYDPFARAYQHGFGFPSSMNQSGSVKFAQHNFDKDSELLKPRISLLHATYFRAEGPMPVMRAWMELAASPESVEYLVSVTRTDKLAIEQTGDVGRVVVEPPDGRSTAVRNWNSLALRASGDFLFVIADDLMPCDIAWDTALEEIAKRHDPLRLSYVVKVSDSESERDTKLRHPVVSRRYFDKYGLWSPVYSGMYVDTDLTLSAFWRSTIIDGRHIRLNHSNPVVNPKFPPSISFSEANSNREYNLGRTAFDKRWPTPLQGTRVKLVQPSAKSLSCASVRLRIAEAFSIIARSRYLNWLRLRWRNSVCPPKP